MGNIGKGREEKLTQKWSLKEPGLLKNRDKCRQVTCILMPNSYCVR